MQKYKLKKNKDKMFGFIKTLFEKYPLEEYKRAGMSLFCNGEIQIDNCKAIMVYNENVIKIDMGKIIVSIEGTDLKLETLKKGYITVRGKVFTLKYIYER